MKYANGKRIWTETFWFITKMLQSDPEVSSKYFGSKYYEQTGSIREVDFIEGVTDEFEKMNKGRQWDGEWSDEAEAFLKKKVGELE